MAKQPLYAGRITADPDVLVGKPVVRGTRISVEAVLEHLVDNPDLDELFADFPQLTLEDVRACLAYAEALVAGKAVTPPPGPHPHRREAARPTA